MGTGCNGHPRAVTVVPVRHQIASKAIARAETQEMVPGPTIATLVAGPRHLHHINASILDPKRAQAALQVSMTCP